MDNLTKFLQKIETLKEKGKIDLSSEEDLSLAVMNLVSLEEHFYFTGAKTGKSQYYQFLEQIRRLRQDLLERLIGQTEGELWCVSKHLLAASMRLIEVGTKYQSQGKKNEAEDLFAKAWSLYSLFWGLKLGAIKVDNLKKKEEDLPEKLEEVLKKIVDCCQ